MSGIDEYLSLVGDSADIAPPSYWSNYNFYTTLNSRAARNIFTTAFVVLNLFIGLLGVLLLNRRNQLQLLRGKNQAVPLYRLSPWLSATDTFMYTWKTRRLPGGIFGLFMLSTGIFGIVQQFFVSSFITSAAGFYGSCNFTNGLVIQPPPVDSKKNAPLIIANSYWPAANLAVNAQIAAIKHGDPPGIYAKANSDTNFTVAKDNDYLGTWCCTRTSDPFISFPPGSSAQTIKDTLFQKGLQYGSASSWDESRLSGGYLFWSASVAQEVRQPWKVKASVGPAIDIHEPINIYNLDCTMSAPAVTWALAKMSSQTALETWAGDVFGRLVLGSDILRPGRTDMFATTLEISLNAMVMSTASRGSAISVVTDDFKSHYNSTDTYRCATERTIVALPIWVMLGFMILHLLGFLIADIILLLLICCSSQRRVVSDVPSDIPSWQLATLRDRFHQEPAIEAKNMHQYVYGWCPDHKRLLFKEKGASQDQEMGRAITAYQPVQTSDDHRSSSRNYSPQGSIQSVPSPL